jgi:hypothetical protein
MRPIKGSRKEIVVFEGRQGKWGVKGLERLWASARRRPSVTAHTKGSGLSTSKANARAMLKEKRATTLTQFFVARLMIKSGEEADGTPVSQEVKETHKFETLNKVTRDREAERPDDCKRCSVRIDASLCLHAGAPAKVCRVV